jgi:hypothetical protein
MIWRELFRNKLDRGCIAVNGYFFINKNDPEKLGIDRILWGRKANLIKSQRIVCIDTFTNGQPIRFPQLSVFSLHLRL